MTGGHHLVVGRTLGRERDGQRAVLAGREFEGYGDIELHTGDVALVLHDDGQADGLAGGIFH